MKSLLLLPVVAALSYGQAAVDNVEFTASKLQTDGEVVRGTGNVRAKVGRYTLEADEGTWHRDTGELELRGHARALLPPSIVLRYEHSAAVAVDPVSLSAERITVKDGLLRGSGHVKAKYTEKLFEADQIEMFLKIGDARLLGNVRINGGLPPVGRGGSRDFPPDIIR